jgi:aspartyl-tRNA(Asn)/glutamyl-tRNA(Gln) amidotransferase subunit B
VKMEEGSMRVDANVSVRPVGQQAFGTRAEIKNMNSLRSLGRALDYEVARQIALIESGDRVVQETRHWNEEDGRTHSMRSKEEAFDYRYFPEPDLVPVAPTDAMRGAARDSLPELPAARRARLMEQWGITESDARILVGTPRLAPFAEAAVDALDGGTPKDVVNWCNGDVLAYLNETGLSVEVLPLAPDALAELVALVADGTLSRNLAKDVLGECLRTPLRPKQVVAERGLAQVSDESELVAVIDGILAANATDVDEYRAGDDKAKKKKRGFFMGEAMKATQGKGNPQLLNKLLDEKLAG